MFPATPLYMKEKEHSQQSFVLKYSMMGYNCISFTPEAIIFKSIAVAGKLNKGLCEVNYNTIAINPCSDLKFTQRSGT